MNKNFYYWSFIFLKILFFHSIVFSQDTEKLRVLVLTDIENESDDAQSLIRFLTYSNKWDVEGIITTTSYWKKDSITDEKIHEILAAYKLVQPNLLIHEDGFPSYDFLKEKVKKGLPEYGMKGVGKGKDSEGSEWILEVLEKEDDRPIWITVWGGTNCLAQTLWKIKNTYSEEKAAKLYRKLRIYTISDQDDSGPWIRKNFPTVFYICSPGYEHDGAGGYHFATWTGIAGDDMHGRFRGGNKALISQTWLRKHIQTHGSLGATYPDVGSLMEGNSPSFLFLIPNGLNVPEHPNYGGWGGRYELYTPRLQKWFFEPETRPIWSNAVDEYYSPIDTYPHTSNQVTIWRWREAFQNDFAARMDWCIKPYSDANHPPIANLTDNPNMTVKSGETIILNGSNSFDPDGDNLFFEWVYYKEAGSLNTDIIIKSPKKAVIPLTIPEVKKRETAHIILKITDNGIPALTRYKRIILTILPK